MFITGRYNFLRSRNIAIFLSLLCLSFIVITFNVIISSGNNINFNIDEVLSLIIIDGILLSIIFIIVGRKIFLLISQQKQGVVGSNLQSRMIIMFSLVAIIPIVLMSIFALIFFNYGVRAWMDKKVSTAIENSIIVAESYLEEHKKLIKSDIINMSNGISRSSLLLQRNPALFHRVLSGLAGGSLSEIVVFTRDKILAKNGFSLSAVTLLPDSNQLNQADLGQVVILENDVIGRLRAIIKLHNFYEDSYLLVSRLVDAKVTKHVENNKGAANEYNNMKNEMSQLQIKYFIIFMVVSLVLLFVVILLGFIFSAKIVKPISSLIIATNRAKTGDLTVRVQEGRDNDEITTLQKTFNNMIEQLEMQRKEIASAQRRAAWSDVARRIAHEIKNPLTPIQLSSERLKRKFINEITDKEKFTSYVNTIVRNVNTIGAMVEEFVNFAKLPAPNFQDGDINALLSEIFTSLENNKILDYEFNLLNKPVFMYFDQIQITQVINNLIKNAYESIEEKTKREKSEYRGKIKIKVFIEDNNLNIKIIDNGLSFPANIIDRLTEPYVTTKSKGTGLGLAIVKKIIEDHNGNIIFANLDENNKNSNINAFTACVTLTFLLKA